MKQQIEWIMPEGAWSDAQKNLYTKRIKWLINQKVSMACSRFDEWYIDISDNDMNYYIEAVGFAVSKYVTPYTKDLPMSIHTIIKRTCIEDWWRFGINGDSVCEFNDIGRLGSMSWVGVQKPVIDNYHRRLLSRVYASKTHAEWIALAWEKHRE